MNNVIAFKVLLAAIGIGQFLVVPYFSNMALSGKAILFTLISVLFGYYLFKKQKVFFIPKIILPLIGLAISFGLSLFFSVQPGVGVVQFGYYFICLLFCLVVVNFPISDQYIARGILSLLQYTGLLIALLCLYQYAHWLVFGESSIVLIPYLLPPGGSRVGGVYGQPNLTALILLLSLFSWFFRIVHSIHERSCVLRILYFTAFFIVSTAFFLTGSRAGLLALSGLVIGIIFLVRKQYRIELQKFILPSFILILTYAIVSLPHSVVGTTGPGSHASFSIDARFFLWAVSVLQFIDHPFLGVGLDHFKLFIPNYSLPAHDLLGFIEYETMGYSNWAHNEPLQIVAESGLAGLLFLGLFSFSLFRYARNEIAKHKEISLTLVMAFLLVPFFIQGLLSWPFRHPGLLFIFFLILGCFLRNSNGLSIPFTLPFKVLSILTLLIIISTASYLAVNENYLLDAKREAKYEGCGDLEIERLANNAFIGFATMKSVLPMCLKGEHKILNEKVLLEKYRPYYEKLANLQGTYQQWHNLALVYYMLENYENSKKAISMSLERQPTFADGWAFLHRLNIEEAARATGQPIETFIPPEKNYSVDFYDSVFKN